jgi:hypothetical protein
MIHSGRSYRLPLLCLFLLLDLLIPQIFSPAIDWAPMWTGARLGWTDPSSLYDFALVGQLQQPIVGNVGDHPFIYPPTALLMLMPFSVLPFWVSFAVFLILSCLLFLWAASQMKECDLGLVLTAPPVFLAVLVGQSTPLIAGLVIIALSFMNRNEGRAGALLAVAAVIKPTLLLLAPFAMLAGGNYRALKTAAAAGICLVALSLFMFGIDPWLAWFDALPRFQQLFIHHEVLVRAAASPFALGMRLGVATPWIMVACAGLALPFVWIAFARSEDVALRSAALMGGALLITPYAMNYEVAVLAPALMTLRTPRLRDTAAPALYAVSLFATASVVGLIAVTARFAFPFLAPLARYSVSKESRKQLGIDIPA